MTKVFLKKHEQILGIECESCAGPGWSNRIVAIHIGDIFEKTYRTVCLQSDEQPEVLRYYLFDLVEKINDLARETLR